MVNRTIEEFFKPEVWAVRNELQTLHYAKPRDATHKAKLCWIEEINGK